MTTTYQQVLQLNTLYSTIASGVGNGSTLQPFIEVLGGVANIYGSVNKPVSAPSGMTNAVPDGLQGIENFGVVPNYLYITEASGTITSVIVSGVKATIAS